MKLKARWDELCIKYAPTKDLQEQLWKELHDAYSGKNRFYHNLHHLEYMFELLDHHRESIEDLEAIGFSIFYHDVVYKASKGNNEEKSADLAEERMRSLGCSKELIDCCRQQIMATKWHQSGVSKDCDCLLDFDLGVLGEEWEVYEVYTKNIRKEYAIYPDFIYNKGRKKVLKHFLDMGSIYKTEEFKTGREEKARINLQQELFSLNS